MELKRPDIGGNDNQRFVPKRWLSMTDYDSRSFLAGLAIGLFLMALLIPTVVDLFGRGAPYSTVDKLGERICEGKGMTYSKPMTVKSNYLKVVCMPKGENEVIYDSIVVDGTKIQQGG